MEFRLDLKNVILNTDEYRYCEVYKITNIINQKIYVGRTVSHILNNGKYRPYGMEGRFRSHISEAFSTKKNQCKYLNNAIRKYGVENFTLQLIRYCHSHEVDEVEIDEISKHNSLYPNGYNLTTGGQSYSYTNEQKYTISEGVVRYYKELKFQKFNGIIIDSINFDKYIKPLRRDGSQYGWYVYIKGKKVDFGGIHITLDKSKEMAYEFLNELVRRNNC
jgi:hypothetical protein